MDGIPAKKLASTIGLPVESLLVHLKDMGIQIESETDLVTGVQQLRLLQRLPALEPESPANRLFAISEVQAATDLRDLNRLLTEAMSARKMDPRLAPVSGATNPNMGGSIRAVSDKRRVIVVQPQRRDVGDEKPRAVRVAARGQLQMCRRPGHQRRSMPVPSKTSSTDTSVQFSSRVWAASIRSQGSR